VVHEPDVFTFDLQELNNSVAFFVSLSNISGKHVKVKTTGALAVFKSLESFEDYKKISDVCCDSAPYEASFTVINSIAQKESNGVFQIMT